MQEVMQEVNKNAKNTQCPEREEAGTIRLCEVRNLSKLEGCETVSLGYNGKKNNAPQEPGISCPID
jgi:hypothetical protein